MTLGPPPAIAGDECDDWRLRAAPAIEDRGDRGAISFGGTYPLACGERDWWIAMLDHPHYVRAMFDTYFRAAGGRFAGGVKERRAPADATPFAMLESPPLYDVVRDVNKLSNNVMARQIFLTLATTSGKAPATTAKAADAIKRWLAARKLAMPGLVLENGSGLSRHERNTAGGLNRLLIAAEREQRARRIRELARRRGDRRHRRAAVPNGAVAGQALLKTGSLEGVRALAGYVIDASGRRFIVVAIVNDRECRACRTCARLSRAMGLSQRRGVGPGAAALIGVRMMYFAANDVS